jgi:hypothetical protein
VCYYWTLSRDILKAIPKEDIAALYSNFRAADLASLHCISYLNKDTFFKDAQLVSMDGVLVHVSLDSTYCVSCGFHMST